MGDLQGEEDSIYGNTRLNILQVIEERNRALNKVRSRLDYVAFIVTFLVSRQQTILGRPRP